jgi:hypothetical protein
VPGAEFGAVRRVALDGPGRRWAFVRELCGLDEESVGGRSTFDAVRLLDRLLVDEPGTCVAPGRASTLTLPERDLLLAAVWSAAWNPRIAGIQTCGSCDEPFDYDLDLDNWAGQVRLATMELPSEDGVYTTDAGVRFRLPTGEDERAVVGLADDEAERVLLERCLVDPDPGTDTTAVQKAMEQVGSGLDVDVDLTCPECDVALGMRFQMQAYLLGAIEANWRSLVDEIHRLAITYGWSLTEIAALPRSRRRAFLTILDDLPSHGTPL